MAVSVLVKNEFIISSGKSEKLSESDSMDKICEKKFG